MVMGMCCQYNDSTDAETKEKIAALARTVTGKFKEKYGVIRCVDLKSNAVPCAELIEYCAELAENTIKEKI